MINPIKKNCPIKFEATVIRSPEELYQYVEKIANKSGIDLEKLCEGLRERQK